MDRLLEKLRDRRAVAVLEFAVVAPFLILLIMGVFDLGNALQQEIRLYEAARAGAQYALSFPTGNTPGVANAAIVTAVKNAGSGLNITASATLSCYCPGVSGAQACSSISCTSNGFAVAPERYVLIDASSPFSPIIIPLHTIRSAILERVQ